MEDSIPAKRTRLEVEFETFTSTLLDEGYASHILGLVGRRREGPDPSGLRVRTRTSVRTV